MLPKQFPGAREPRHHGANRNIQHLRDFLVLHFFQVGQDQHFLIAGLQRRNSLLDQVGRRGESAPVPECPANGQIFETLLAFLNGCSGAPDRCGW